MYGVDTKDGLTVNREKEAKEQEMDLQLPLSAQRETEKVMW